MKFSIETPPNSNIFKQAIIKSLNENKQLIFSKKLTICQSSYQNNINTQYQEFPLMEITDIKDIIDIPNTEGKLSGIICFFDKRTLFIEAITSYLNDNKTKDYIPLTSSIYFPLTPMPQVIAHINKKKFESLLKPHKMPKKFLMNYDGEKKEWNSVQLN